MKIILIIGCFMIGCTPVCKAYHTKTTYQAQCNSEGCIVQYVHETVQTEGITQD